MTTKMTVRIPEDLRVKMRKFVVTQQAGWPKYSLNDCILEGVRMLISKREYSAPPTPEAGHTPEALPKNGQITPARVDRGSMPEGLSTSEAARWMREHQ